MSQRMIKESIITKVCYDTGRPRFIVEEIVNSILKNITLALSQGKEVQFAGFGTFELKKRAARMGRNPHTNEPVPIPARVVPVFKAGKCLKSAVIKSKNDVTEG